jgi:hypothetical protein
VSSAIALADRSLVGQEPAVPRKVRRITGANRSRVLGQVEETPTAGR